MAVFITESSYTVTRIKVNAIRMTTLFCFKINGFARRFPGLMSLKSVDLSPASWMAVAWCVSPTLYQSHALLIIDKNIIFFRLFSGTRFITSRWEEPSRTYRHASSHTIPFHHHFKVELIVIYNGKSNYYCN